MRSEETVLRVRGPLPYTPLLNGAIDDVMAEVILAVSHELSLSDRFHQ